MSKYDLKTELQFLIVCCQAAFDEQNKPFVLSFIENTSINWTGLLELSATHSVRPLLLKGLSGIQTSRIPVDFLESLNTICEKINIHNILFTKELSRIMMEMKKNNVKIIPYKGIALIHTVYKSLGLREFGDMDLLMYPDDIPMMKKTMSILGYQNEFDWTPDEELRMLRVNSEYNFSLIDAAGTHYRVEPHYRAAHPTYAIDLNLKHLDNQIIVQDIGDSKLSFFTPTASLILLLPNHGVSEGWTTLKYLADIHLLIKEYAHDLDWDFMIQEAKRMRLYNNLLVGFGIIQALFQTQLPLFLNHAMDDPAIQKHIAERLESLNTYEKVGFKSQLKKWIFNIKSRDDISVSIKMCFYQLFMPNNSDFIEIKFHKKLFFLYFVLRPFRILVTYFRWKQKVVKKKLSY